MKKSSIVLILIFMSWAVSAGAATITVNSNLDTTGNDGVCTLREAIVAANTNTASGANPGECVAGATNPVIAFSIGSGLQTIAPDTTLPDISVSNLTIDGTTQPGFAGSPLIELNGTNADTPNDWGMRIGGDNSTLRGLIINRFPGSGVVTTSSTTGTLIEGNFIGTDPSGTIDQGNGIQGLAIAGTDALIGGTTPQVRNIISGNGGCGIHFVGGGTNGNQVQGNFIGVAVDGTTALPNTFCGIVINNGADSNIIGGPLATQRNVISGNNGPGVDIGAGVAGTENNAVQGNFIGTDASGLNPVPNGIGVLIREDGFGNLIGGTDPALGNLIAFNDDEGVAITTDPAASTGSQILGNSIHSNGTLGIDLGNDGITANDAGDGDSGPNNLQNFPTLTSAVSDGANLLIQGDLNSLDGTEFRIEFFANSSCDDSGNGEGEVFLGSADITTDGSGNAAINQSLPVSAGGFVTATATGIVSLDTSEFSNCLAVLQVLPTPSPTPSATPGSTAEQVCDDGIDDDGDGNTDCEDLDCIADPSCIEDCDNALDDDGDGDVDCADANCAGSLACTGAIISGAGCGLGGTPGAGGFTWIMILLAAGSFLRFKR